MEHIIMNCAYSLRLVGRFAGGRLELRKFIETYLMATVEFEEAPDSGQRDFFLEAVYRDAAGTGWKIEVAYLMDRKGGYFVTNAQWDRL